MPCKTLMLLLALACVQVQSGSVQKRDTLEAAGDIQKFFNDVGGRKRVDLVLVMDRSLSMSKQTFYLNQKKLAQAILKQYASLDTDYVRLSVITFARDVTTVIDAISKPDNTPNKCSLFYGDNNKWDRDVVYTQNATNLKGTNIKDAFLEAREIFKKGSNHRTNSTRVLLLISDGKYNNEFDPINEANELINTFGVSIYGVGMGTWLEIGNVRVTTSKDENDAHLYGSFEDWQTLVALTSENLLSFTSDTSQEWIHMYGCDCMADSTCFCDLDRGNQLCRCNRGLYLNDTASTCNECPLNTYKEDYGNDDCTPCPPGYITDNKGSTLRANCRCANSTCTDPCENSTCNDHQECRALNDTAASCICKDGWEGDDCSVNHDTCVEMSSTCLHESRCVDGLGQDAYSCVCVTWGYVGTYCEINQNECTPDMCVNNGTCIDQINNFLCECTDDWHGRYCQDFKTTTTSTTTTTTTPASTPAPVTKPDSTLWIIIGASVGGGLLIIIIIIVVACCVCNKRKEKNKEEVKNVAQQFSGFWKRRTIRGSKYVKEMEEDANGGLPSAPAGHRPDLIESTIDPNASIEHLKNEEYAVIPYETVTLKTGMESWQNYITELEVSKVIDRAMIAKLNGDKRALTSAWMYNPEEQTRIQDLMDEPDDNVPLLLQDGEYHIQENDGTLAVGRTIGSSQLPKTVAIGKTKTYLIVAIAPDETDAGKARREVQWIVDHISGEGY